MQRLWRWPSSTGEIWVGEKKGLRQQDSGEDVSQSWRGGLEVEVDAKDLPALEVMTRANSRAGRGV